jgi:benzoylsuccinyl-CoA thiolase BbsB subunit
MNLRDVYVIGVGMTKLYRKAPVSIDELGRLAARDALKDADIELKEIEEIVVGNMIGLSKTICLGQRIGITLGCQGIPIKNTEGACSSSAVAAHLAWERVASGFNDVTMAIGVECLSSYRAGGTAFSPDLNDPEALQGMTMPGLYAMRAMRYMYDHGATKEDLATIAVKNRKHATVNPYSDFRTPLTIEEVLNARVIAEPFTLLMCCPNSDGGAAVIFATKEKAEKLGKKLVRLAASTITTGIFTNSFRDMTYMDITYRCAKKAYDMAGLGPEDVDMVECHDAFVVGELLYYESLGFCKHGESAEFLRRGDSDYGGKVVFSPRGGLMSCGHPTGASGAAQIVEATWQVRGDAGERQVPDCKVALTHVTGGGVYGTENAICTVHILTS